MHTENTLYKQNGFEFIPGDVYLPSELTENTYQAFHQAFKDSLFPDGVRNRSYLKLKWCRATDEVSIADNQNYFQSAASNVDDGGKVRTFAVIDPIILQSPIMRSIIEKNIQVIKTHPVLTQYNELTLGIHFIQYTVSKFGASYASPAGLHIDDEPLVFVHLISLSDNAIGGDNLIATLDDQEITNVVRLKNPLDTICLTREVYHAVTPLGSVCDQAHRDVILFTVEPDSTQKETISPL